MAVLFDQREISIATPIVGMKAPAFFRTPDVSRTPGTAERTNRHQKRPLALPSQTARKQQSGSISSYAVPRDGDCHAMISDAA
jgi:hypothetical protein